MANTLQHDCKNGAKIFYKDEITTGQFWMIQKASKKKGAIDEQLLQENLIRALVTKIVTHDGQELTDRLEVINYIKALSAKEWMKLGDALTTAAFGEKQEAEQDEESPKEIEILPS